MDSFDKRQRERRKLEKRKEKEARRKERADNARKNRSEPGTTGVVPDDRLPPGETPASETGSPMQGP